MADVSGIPSGSDLVQDGAPVDQVPFIAGLDAIRAAIIAVNADAVAAAELAGRASAIEATLTYRLTNPQGGPNSLVYDIPATFTLDAMPLRGHYLFVAAHTNVGGGTYIRIRRYDGANYVNGTSTVILKRGSADLDPGDIVAGEVVMLMSLGAGPDSYRLIGTPRSDITEIEANIADALSAIASEAADRISADAALQANITAANTARSNADDALNIRIDNANTYRAENDAILQANITAAANTAAAATASEAATRDAADTALAGRIDDTEARFPAIAVATAFAGDLEGIESVDGYRQNLSDLDEAAPIPPDALVVRSEMGGSVIRVRQPEFAFASDSAQVAIATYCRLLPDSIWRVRTRFRRAINSSVGDAAVQFRVRYYDETKASLGDGASIRGQDIEFSDGILQWEADIYHGQPDAWAPPAGAAYFKVFDRVFDATTTTDIGLLDAKDVTEERRHVAEIAAGLSSAIDAEASARAAGISAEAAARAAAVSAEASARAAADNALQTALDGEETNRASADAALQGAIEDAEATAAVATAAETAARAAAVSAEASARAAADTALQAALDDEETSRTTADEALQEAINTLEADTEAALAAEVADRIAAVSGEAEARAEEISDLQDALNAGTAASAAAIATEAADRAAAVTAEATARQAADDVLSASVNDVAADAAANLAQETADRAAALAAEATDRASADTALGVRIDGAEAEIIRIDDNMSSLSVTDVSRPGEAPQQFSHDYTGDPVTRGPLATGERVVDAELGAIWSMPDSGIIAWRRAFAMEQTGRVYQLRIGIKRLSDSVDPDGDAVEVFWQNLNLNKSAVSLVKLATWLNPLVEDRLQVVTLYLSRDASIDGIDYVPPVSTRYGTPLVRTYGFDVETGIAFMAWRDVTDELFGPAIQSIQARLAALETLSITTLTVTPSGVQELGTSVTPTLTWTYAGEGSLSVVRVDGLAIATDAVSYVAPAAITASTTYTLRIVDTLNRADEAQVSVTFQPRVFWGASASDVLTSSGVIGLAGSGLQGSKALSRTVTTADSYVYVAYPAAFGAPSTYKLFGFDEDPVGTLVSVTTAAGHTANYNVFRSPLKLTGSVPVEVS
ncbi:hypothetical protein FDP22_12635 [Paroceanicella profunda]|uniref:DUF1983 domain-containing protein n=1 Tax=Paroceanicella profunda TaxID=2579971 RepID=A0A5B8FY65_9RHOB|nr:hypothetical protein [Paroceanicella profunda]QDL92554.1 hypothetical protein FDP22_12635 [Paroceanicella profunda]